MNTVERILKLIKDKGLLEIQFLNDLNLNKNRLSEWKSGKTKSYNKYIYQIAEYLNVSVDYLLCKTDDPNPPGKKADDTVDEPIFITMQSYYKELPVEDKEQMDMVLKTIFKEAFPKNKDKKDNGIQK